MVGRSVRAAVLLLCGVGLASAETRPTPSPTPTSLELLRTHLASRVVTGGDASGRFVVAIRLTDTNEAFTIELDGNRVELREGLPPSAAVMLSGRRRTMTNILRGSETLSGAVRANLVDVHGDIDRLFELISCCVRPAPTPTPSAPAR